MQQDQPNIVRTSGGRKLKFRIPTQDVNTPPKKRMNSAVEFPRLQMNPKSLRSLKTTDFTNEQIQCQFAKDDLEEEIMFKEMCKSLL